MASVQDIEDLSEASKNYLETQKPLPQPGTDNALMLCTKIRLNRRTYIEYYTKHGKVELFSSSKHGYYT